MKHVAPLRHLAVLAAVALTTAAGLVGLSSAPASAALCSGKGVNVVVDFNGLGGGVQKGCDPNGANRGADKVFPAAGFILKYATRQPGFVCRVNGTPGNDPCVNTAPANAYWGLFWSDGKSGKWSYASSGVGGLKVPSGGFVAFSWQGSQSKDPPSTTPRNSAPAPKPTPKPTPKPKPTAKPGNGATGPTKTARPTKTAAPTVDPTTAATQAGAKASASAAPSATASASADPSASAAATASETLSSETLAPTDEDSPATASRPVNGTFQTDDDGGGLPTWVPVVVIVGLAGGAGGALWWRRRTGAA